MSTIDSASFPNNIPDDIDDLHGKAKALGGKLYIRDPSTSMDDDNGTALIDAADVVYTFMTRIVNSIAAEP
jgi:hypothetical protein